MIFKLIFGNHPRGDIIYDPLTLVGLLLEAARQRVDFELTPFGAGHCNVYLDNFTPDDVDTVRRAREIGGEVVVVATEFITGDTFNDFPFGDGSEHYSDKAHWKSRHDSFLEVARMARAVWVAAD